MPFLPDPRWPMIGSSLNGSGAPAVDAALAGSGQPLPAPDLPFPIISPFVVRADLQKVLVGERLIRRDSDYPVYARARLAALLAGESDWLLASSADPALVLAALNEAVERLQADDAGAWRLGTMAGLALEPWSGRLTVRPTREDAIGLADWLNQRVDREPSQARRDLQLFASVLALDLQEDFVIMAPAEGHSDEGAGGVCAEVRAEGMFVSFPSGWAPHEKISQPLSAIHAPVADGEALRRAGPGLSLAMLQKGPFVRYVWTLSESLALDRHPGRRSGTGGSHTRANRVAARHGSIDLNSIAFRCERQVTLALPRTGRALFLIRVYVVPLLQAANTAERRAALVASLQSMSDAVVAYKNIGVLRERVMAAWG